MSVKNAALTMSLGALLFASCFPEAGTAAKVLPVSADWLPLGAFLLNPVLSPVSANWLSLGTALQAATSLAKLL